MNALHQDGPFTKAMTAGIRLEIADLANGSSSWVKPVRVPGSWGTSTPGELGCDRMRVT
jgi:hypothetical protein